MKLHAGLAVAVLLTLTPIARAQSDRRPVPPESDPTGRSVRVLTDLTVIDGSGQPARAGVSLVLVGERIDRIVDGRPTDVPTGAEWVDLGGFFAVPGLIDVHTHLATGPSAPGYTDRVRGQLRRLLGTGVTAVRDMAGDGRVLAYLARQTRLGDLPGPDICFAAVLGGPRLFGDRRIRDSSRGETLGTAPWAHTVTDETDLDALMLRIEGLGASGVKVYSDLAPDLLARVARAAKARGLAVWAHWVVTPRSTGALDVVRAGVEVVSHAHMPLLDTAVDDRVSSARAMAGIGAEALLAAMKERGTVLDATLVAAQRLPARPEWVAPGAFAVDLVRAARAAGVMVATGSDHPDDGDLPAIHLEYRALVEAAGWTPGEVLEAATGVSARVLGIADRAGVLREGMEATFVLLDRDPAADVAALAAPRFVLKRGQLYSGEQLRGSGAEDGALTSFPGSRSR
ncbi:MAG: amidohydrolase family protein [Planctomycetota bacterium]